MFTSGSTGRPKGVEIVHRGLSHIIDWQLRELGLSASDRVSLVSGVGFDGSVWETWATLCGGATLHLPDEDTRIDPERLRDFLVQRSMTLAYAPTPLTEALLELPWPDQTALRTLQVGGERLRRRPPASLPFELLNLYGPTEFTVWATTSFVAPHGEGLPDIGRPLDECGAWVVDHRGRLCADGIVGELWLSGPQLARGYRGLPERTADAFPTVEIEPGRPQRVYRTGDLVRRRADGCLEFVGRRDGQIKLRGVRIEVGEIEALLQQHDGVGSCAVVLHGEDDPYLAAFVEPADHGRPPEPGALSAHLSGLLPRTMVPTRWAVMDALPRTASGKLDRKALPEVEAVVDGDTGSAPRGELERGVADIFAAVLSVSSPSREASLFNLGGHSLHVIRIANLCRERFGADLSVSEVMEAPTVAEIATCIADSLGVSPSSRAELPRANRTSPVPLSPHQRALWLELRLLPEADTYHIPSARVVVGALDPERFRAALHRVHARHEALRARVIDEESRPRLVLDVPVSALDVDHVVDDSPSAETIRREIAAPFDLQRGPLWRARLWSDGDQSTVLLVTHHIVSDASSIAILWRDLEMAYMAPARPLPAPDLDLADICAYERDLLDRDRAELEAFWKDCLGDADALTPDLPPPLVRCPEGAAGRAVTATLTLPSAVGHRVRELSRAWGTTPFVVYLTAYLTLLRLYSGRDDVTVGTAASLRDHAAAQDVLGYLVSPVAVRHALSGDQSFEEAARGVTETWRKAHAHARLPLDLVLQAAFGDRRHEIGGSVGVFFTYFEVTADESFAGFDAESIDVGLDHAKFRAGLEVQDGADGVRLHVEARRDALDPQTAERFLRHLEALLTSGLATPTTPLWDLGAMSHDELTKIVSWQGAAPAEAPPLTVHGLFAATAAEHAESVALEEGDRQLTYRDVDRGSAALAGALRASGVEAGQRVPLVMRRGIEQVVATLAVLRCGAAYVPLDPTDPPARLRSLIQKIGAVAGVRDAGGSAPTTSIAWIDAGRPGPADAETPDDVAVSPDAAAYVMFTSGSTGVPKGVEVPHRGIVRLVMDQTFAAMGPDECWLHMAPTAFDLSTLETWAALLNGGRCVVLPEGLPSPAVLADTITRHGITSAWITSSLFNALVDEAPSCLRGLRQLLVGGEALSPRHIARAMRELPDTTLINGYGPTENTTFTTCHQIAPEDVTEKPSIPIGRPLRATTVQVLDREGMAMPIGVPGELVTGGLGVALGYVGEPGLTAERFLPDPARPGGSVYRTGDRARWRPDGTLEFLGRLDDQVKVRGRRIEPGELTAVLERHGGVRAAAAIVARESSNATRLLAFVVSEPSWSGGDLLDELRESVSATLPEFLRPDALVRVDELPTTRSGKLDVRALTGLTPKSTARPSRDAANAGEARVLEVWRARMDAPTAGMDDDFFARGGTSILAIRLAADVERAFGVQFDFARFLERPTPECVADMVARADAVSPLIVPLTTGRGNATLFCVPGLGGHVLSYRDLAEQLANVVEVVGLQTRELDRIDGALDDIEAMAAVLVPELLEHVGQRPFALLGYSFGGALAYEMTRLLEQAGRPPALLTFIDAYAPGTIRPLSAPDKVRMHARNALQGGVVGGLAYMANKTRRRLRAIAGLKPDREHVSRPRREPEPRLAVLERRCRDAAERFEPRPIDSGVLMLRAARLNEWLCSDEAVACGGWRDLARGGVRVEVLDCEHLEILNEPHLSTLTGLLSRAICEALKDSTDSQPEG